MCGCPRPRRPGAGWSGCPPRRDVAAVRQLHLAADKLGLGLHAHRDEQAVRRKRADAAGLDVPQGDLFQLLPSRYGFYYMVVDDVNVGGLFHAVDQGARGAEGVPPVDDDDAPGKAGKVERVLRRGVSAAGDDHVPAAVERAVAGRAVGDAAAAQAVLVRRRAAGAWRPCTG